MKWNLLIDEEHASVIINALDLYSRLLMGQIEELDRFFRDLGFREREDVYKKIDVEVLEALVGMLKAATFPGCPKNGSYGIYNEEISDKARVAWDIHQVIRHRLAWHRVGKDPDVDVRVFNEMLGVSFDTPMKSSHNVSLPTIKPARRASRKPSTAKKPKKGKK